MTSSHLIFVATVLALYSADCSIITEIVVAVASKYHCTSINVIENDQFPIADCKTISGKFFTRVIGLENRKKAASDFCTVNLVFDLKAMKQVKFSKGKREKWIFVNPINQPIRRNAFEQIKVTFNSAFVIISQTNNTVTVAEAYRVKRDQAVQFRSVAIVKVDEFKIDLLEKLEFYKRKADFGGIKLLAGAGQSKPNAFIGHRNDGRERLEGFLVDILKALTTELNFQFNVLWYSYGTGEKIGEGIWSGMLGNLDKGDVDMILSNVNMNGERVEIIDFPGTITRTRFQIFVELVQNDADIYLLLQPLSATAWQALAGWIATVCILISICGYVKTRYFKLTSPHPCTWFASNLQFVLQGLCQQASFWIPKEGVFRIIVLTVYLTSAILVPLYSASLISSLTRGRYQMPFQTLEELARTDHKVLVTLGGGDLEITKTSGNQILQRKNIQLVAKPTAPGLPYEVQFSEMCGNNGARALLAEESLATYTIQNHPYLATNCNLAAIKDKLNVIHQTFVLPKGSPYTEAFKFGLMQMREKGIISRFRMRHWPQRDKPQRVQVDPVTYADVTPIFHILLFGLASSFALLLCEIFYYCNCNCESRKVQPRITLGSPYQ